LQAVHCTRPAGSVFMRELEAKGEEEGDDKAEKGFALAK
jgi:hypothetical protein